MRTQQHEDGSQEVELSARETEVLELLTHGSSNKEIAAAGHQCQGVIL
jgi:DNA-binding NarL/FixJ family response regulator